VTRQLFCLGGLGHWHLDAGIRSTSVRRFGMRLRNLNDNRAAARVSNKVYLPEIQFLDKAS